MFSIDGLSSFIFVIILIALAILAIVFLINLGVMLVDGEFEEEEKVLIGFVLLSILSFFVIKLSSSNFIDFIALFGYIPILSSITTVIRRNIHFLDEMLNTNKIKSTSRAVFAGLIMYLLTHFGFGYGVTEITYVSFFLAMIIGTLGIS